MSESVVPDGPAFGLAQKRMLYGAVWCIGGITVTGMTYLAASGPGGGIYVVAWGAILFGAIQFFRGLAVRETEPTANDIGYDALAEATKLEARGRMQEALEAYQKIIKDYPNTAAGLDAQKSLESLKRKSADA